MNSTEHLNKAVKQMLAATEVANSSASTLADVILIRHPGLASDAMIVREAAALLQHVVQNFSRTAATSLTAKPAGRKGAKHES